MHWTKVLYSGVYELGWNVHKCQKAMLHMACFSTQIHLTALAKLNLQFHEEFMWVLYRCKSAWGCSSTCPIGSLHPIWEFCYIYIRINYRPVCICESLMCEFCSSIVYACEENIIVWNFQDISARAFSIQWCFRNNRKKPWNTSCGSFWVSQR